MADLSDTIAAQAALPITSSDDGQSATGQPLPNLIEADKYLAAKRARRKRTRGLFFNVITTPGTLDDGGMTKPGSGFSGGGFC